jgi:hypothetical protein
MQHFDNLEQGRNDFADSSHYTEEDFDYILYQPSSKKPYLDPELKQFYFVYEDAWGTEYELFTTIECIWKVTPPDPTSWASPDDFYGYTELKSWEVISVEDHEGNEVKPEDVLTEKQLLAYTQGLEAFIEE